jgi:hypothetical protein
VSFSRRLTQEEAAGILARAQPIPVQRGASPIEARDLVGRFLDGTEAVITPATALGHTLLLFASASCNGCHELLAAASEPERFGLSSKHDSVLVVVRDNEPRDELLSLLANASCVEAPEAFVAYGVTGTPFFSLVSPSRSTVATEGVAWGVDSVKTAVEAALAGSPSVEVGRLQPGMPG